MTFHPRLALLALVMLAACQPAAETPAEAPAAPSDPAGSPAAAVPAPGGTPVMLTEMTAGDRGCYMTVTEASGEAVIHLGAFELCEQEALVGKQVVLTTAPTPVQAESCQGNPECAETETVDLVTAVRAVE